MHVLPIAQLRNVSGAMLTSSRIDEPPAIILPLAYERRIGRSQTAAYRSQNYKLQSMRLLQIHIRASQVGLSLLSLFQAASHQSKIVQQ